jgi:hypothetical protein
VAFSQGISITVHFPWCTTLPKEQHLAAQPLPTPPGAQQCLDRHRSTAHCILDDLFAIHAVILMAFSRAVAAATKQSEVSVPWTATPASGEPISIDDGEEREGELGARQESSLQQTQATSNRLNPCFW